MSDRCCDRLLFKMPVRVLPNAPKGIRSGCSFSIFSSGCKQPNLSTIRGDLCRTPFIVTKLLILFRVCKFFFRCRVPILMERFFLSFRNMLHVELGLGSTMLIETILLATLALIAVASYYLAKLLLHYLAIAIEKTPTKWDDDLVTPRLMKAVAQLAPAITVNWGLPLLFFSTDTGSVHWVSLLTSFYIIWASVRILVIFTGNLYIAMAHRPRTRPYAVKGIFQMLKLMLIGLGALVALSMLIGTTPVAILTALGASAAVLMLVFKDTVLGLVASVQLTANKMLQRGDWIICDRHDVNGEVEDISLTTVKVRNFDNSVTTIPPYSLVSEPFRNYQPMRASGGRRVERSVCIDLESVRFLEAEDLQRLESMQLWPPSPSQPHQGNEDKTVNLGLYRLYLEHYLTHRPDLNKNMMVMVRQMQSTPAGVPLQLYFFTGVTEWKEFERIQSEVFDHVFATAPLFGLRIYQAPSARDLDLLANNRPSNMLNLQKQ